MSKVITQRYEYVCYDDATGNLTALPPTYPTVTDTYIANCAISAANSYGSGNISGAGLTPFSTSPNAQVTLIAPNTNTTFVNISTAAPVALTPGGTPQTVVWLVGPGETVTFPGVWNASGQLTAQACDVTFTTSAIPFALQIMWGA